MRDADVPLELVEYYCKEVLNAQNEEELEILKSDMIVTLQGKGLDDITISNFFSTANNILDIDNIAFDENGKIVTKNQYSKNMEGMEQPISVTSSAEQPALVGGAAVSILVAVLALKQAILKRRRNNDTFKQR